ncbi:MAG TPA: AMP-binding protein [Nocardioides sp.]|uniref:AMP-binding protein n=1 Tax=Nocardioides sp. TaxID=35761 RepID=UPI002E35193B|nr:AMP-binding protein [Nocardioides sp.]HEX5087797.1 AMP-binding protein [Nocardioides sp.]
MTALPVARPTHWLLGGVDEATALVEGDRVVTYAELHDLVRAERERVGGRRLVALEARPTVAFVVSYLAALAGGHPVLLLAEGGLHRHEHLLATYRPGTADALHPDLALLLSTSGSTGSPKLVRLSRSNLLANARSIVGYLGLHAGDVGVTSLPLHYCYGLSVLHSHLLAGASVVLTDLSVADACFWDLAERTGVTGLAGVPHTYALLDSIGFGSRVLPRLPALRYLTQAGGRMPPDRVRDYAGLCRERGIDLFVMYGQTEATARMAYLPPELAFDHPDTVGIPVPGGSFRIAPVRGAPPGCGELVYSGPNVMMGYAESLADLARGPEVGDLHTGDLARMTAAGLVQVMGRLDRQAKVLGHRVDLDRVEAALGDAGVEARLVARPDRLWAFTTRARARARVRDLVEAAAGLRGAAVRVEVVDELPVAASGKPDEAALRAHVEREEALRSAPPTGPVTAEELRDLYAVVLGRPRASVSDSFVALGGDSLSYVEVSTRLGERLGTLPAGWPSLTPAELAALGRQRPAHRRTVPVDVSVLVRAIAITMVVVTHVDLRQWQGGAHVLLAVAGYNLARFQLAVPGRRDRVMGLLRGARSVALPAFLFVGALAAVGHDYRWPTAFLVNGLVGSDSWDAQWQLWFLEVLVWCYLGLALLLAVPLLDRTQRAAPFLSALVALAVTLVVRYAWTGVEAGPTERYTLGVVAWCLALGMCAAYARTLPQRLLVAALAVVATAGFFGDARREAVVAAGVVLLLAGRPVRLPSWAAWALGLLASASLWIYLTHWQVYPPLEDSGHRTMALLGSLVVGLAVYAGVTWLTRTLRAHRRAAPGWQPGRPFRAGVTGGRGAGR